MRILVDAMGGDLAPDEIVKGAVHAQQELGAEIVLVGQRAAIEACLRNEQAKLSVPAGVDCPWHRDYSPPDVDEASDCDESLVSWSESDFAFALSAVIAASVLSASIWSR